MAAPAHEMEVQQTMVDLDKLRGVGLKRSDVRTMKRAMRAGCAPNASVQETDSGRVSALALLDRSIQCRHERLAILRLIAAIEAGAEVRDEQWQYCAEVILRDCDGTLRDLALRAIPNERLIGRNR